MKYLFNDKDRPLIIGKKDEFGNDLVPSEGELSPSQIALIILIGLATKNGILIVEFANQLRAEGKNIKTAVMESASIRLRPILMTSSSTIFGVLPLIISSGPGEASRLTVGITIFAGMFFSTFFTLYVIPVIYLIIGKNTKSINYIEEKLNKELS